MHRSFCNVWTSGRICYFILYFLRLSADFKSAVLLVSSSCYCLLVSLLYRRSISRLWEKQIVRVHVFLEHLLLSVRTICSNLCVSLDIANRYFYVKIILEVAEVTE